MTHHHPLRRFMAKLDSRDRFHEDEREAILALPGHPVQVQSNRDFVRLGEHTTHACLIVEGLVGRFGQSRQGLRQITSVHIAGDMADLHSVVVPDAKSALQALAVTTILRVPHTALLDVAARFPRLGQAFWRECVIDGAIMSEWVLNVGRRTALASMAHILCEMACRYQGSSASGESVSGEMDYHFAATQQHLGDMLGLTPVHVNRILMELRRQGIVTFRSKRVTIHDWARLVTIGEFEPDYLHLPSGNADCRPERALSFA